MTPPRRPNDAPPVPPAEPPLFVVDVEPEEQAESGEGTDLEDGQEARDVEQ